MTLFWPFFIFGLGTHFGPSHKKFDPPMSLPIEKEHHMQILVRIGPTVWPATPLQRDRETDIRVYIYRYRFTYIFFIALRYVHLLYLVGSNARCSFQDATYYFINVAPQFQAFNNGNWKILEGKTRTYGDK